MPVQITIRPPRVRRLLTSWLEASLAAVNPERAIRNNVRLNGTDLLLGGRRYSLRGIRRLVIVGAGKASARMASELDRCLGKWPVEGLVVTTPGQQNIGHRVTVVEAGHPVPSRAGLQAAKRVLRLVQNLTSHDLLFVLLSGGASSLWPVPAPGLTLVDKQRVTQLLLRSGATIQELNTVRKHLSSIKGGQLATRTHARVITLLLSDVVGDDLSCIGSGPTVPDLTTFEEASRILRERRLWSRLPARVQMHLHKGCSGELPDTPKPGHPAFRHGHHLLLATNTTAIAALARAARQHGIRPLVLSNSLTGEAQEIAKVFGAMARSIVTQSQPLASPCCVIAGGELTVTVRGQGQGGRAQEFALAAAQEVRGLPNVWIAGFGTDGRDGPTDVAGAVVSGATADHAQTQELNLDNLLRQNDSYHAFQQLGGHIRTGPTGTNVGDLYLLLVL